MLKGLSSVLLASLLALAVGCSSMSRTQPETEAYGNVSTNNATVQSSSSAYEFDDVPTPVEMNLQSDESFIMETPQVKAGALVYTGWVDSGSLSSFYLRNMPQEGWTPISYFKYDHYLHVFRKADKVCVIRIIKGRFSTKLEIWVSPAMSSSQSDLSEKVLTQ